ARLNYQEFTRQLTRGEWKAMHQPGAYSVPGANMEQTHDRPMREGRTVHVGFDELAQRPAVNGFAVDYNPKSQEIKASTYDRGSGRYQEVGPVVELSTREEAGRGKSLRYRDVQALLP